MRGLGEEISEKSCLGARRADTGETGEVARCFSRIKTDERKNKYPESVTKKGLSPHSLQTLQRSSKDFVNGLEPMNLKKYTS